MHVRKSRTPFTVIPAQAGIHHQSRGGDILMNRAIFIRLAIVAFATLALLTAAACGSDSSTSDESQPSDTTTTSPAPAPPPPPAAQTSPPPAAAPEPTTAPAPAPSEETVPVGHRVGDRAPDFMLALTGDRQVNSADLVSEGKPVFILFHATW